MMERYDLEKEGRVGQPGLEALTVLETMQGSAVHRQRSRMVFAERRQTWGWNPEPHACEAGSPHHSRISLECSNRLST